MSEVIRGIITEVTEAEIKKFSATGRPDESFAQRELFQHYGFTSIPLKDAEAVIWVDGNTVYCIGSDDRRYRLQIGVGEVALYDDQGQKIHITRSGIEMKAKGYVKIDAPVTYFTGRVSIKTGKSGKHVSKTGTIMTVKDGVVTDI